MSSIKYHLALLLCITITISESLKSQEVGKGAIIIQSGFHIEYINRIEEGENHFRADINFGVDYMFLNKVSLGFRLDYFLEKFSSQSDENDFQNRSCCVSFR